MVLTKDGNGLPGLHLEAGGVIFHRADKGTPEAQSTPSPQAAKLIEELKRLREMSRQLVYLRFWEHSFDWKYLHNHSLVWLIDGERRSEAPEHNGKVDSGFRSSMVTEVCLVIASIETLELLAKGVVVEGRLGPQPFILTFQQKAALWMLAQELRERGVEAQKGE